MTDTGAPTPWWEQAHAASFRSGSAGPATPPAYQPPVVEGPPPGSAALSLGLGRGSRERELIRQVAAPLTGTRRAVVLSIKGGVGKTTTVAVAGSLLADPEPAGGLARSGPGRAARR